MKTRASEGLASSCCLRKSPSVFLSHSGSLSLPLQATCLSPLTHPGAPLLAYHICQYLPYSGEPTLGPNPPDVALKALTELKKYFLQPAGCTSPAQDVAGLLCWKVVLVAQVQPVQQTSQVSTKLLSSQLTLSFYMGILHPRCMTCHFLFLNSVRFLTALLCRLLRSL